METQGWATMTMEDYWRAVWHARWLIMALVSVAAIAGYGVASTLPSVYTARATMISPQAGPSQLLSSSIGAMFLGGSSEGRGAQQLLPGVALGFPLTSPNVDIFVAALKSRTLRNQVVSELTKTWGEGVERMILSAHPDTKEKGVIAIVAEAREPRLAADLANGYLQALEARLHRSFDDSMKRQQGLFTTQLERAGKEVEAAEAALIKFQTENRHAGLDAPTRGGVDAVAGIRGAVMGLELQLETLRLRFTDQHPQIVEIKKQIAELKQQYSKSLFGAAMDLPPEGPTAKGPRKEFFVPVEKMTPVQFAFLKLYRNLKIQEAFYTAALQGLQQIEYNGATYPRVEILDPAIPPAFRSSPKKRVIVMVSAGAGLLLGFLLALALDYAARARQGPHERDRTAPARSVSGDGAKALSASRHMARDVDAVTAGATSRPEGQAE